MKRLTEAEKIQPHWWRKSLIAGVLGLIFAYGVVAVFAWFGPGGIDAPMKVQLNMWLISLIWLTVVSLSFLFKTATTALCGLALANVAIYLIFIGLWTLL